MILIWILLGAVMGGLILLLPLRRTHRYAAVLGTLLVHLAFTIWAWIAPPRAMLEGLLAVDDLGLYFLSITSLLFFVAALYGIDYLRHSHRHEVDGSWHHERQLLGSLLLFLSAMTLVTLSQNFKLIWVAIEATTLASAPLVYYYRNADSLEATWKYFMICSVGIALALLGTIFLAQAAAGIETAPRLDITFLTERAGQMSVPWLRGAFIFLLIGYGTKMGLAPFHSWLPDAHSESPPFVSALLSGSLLNCAFLGIIRAYQVCLAASQARFASSLLLVFGFISLVFAAAFVLRQRDFKRMLAYSSVEHMGILAISFGIGKGAIAGGMLHALNHSLIKGALFLISGNIIARYTSRSTTLATGLRRTLPVTSLLWLCGFFAICGMPPFGMFFSKFLIIKAAALQERWDVVAMFLVLLSMIFVGMCIIVMKMYHGESVPDNMAAENNGSPATERFMSLFPPALLLLIALALGLYVPGFLLDRIAAISEVLGVR